jgi:diguanylate cyclase (GGDEF)-like protein/PAS domain S-box-containing protein
MTKYKFSFESIVANTNDIVIVTKADQMNEPGPEIVYVNDAFSDLTGYSRDEALGRSPRFLQGDETDPNTTRMIREALAEKQPVRTTIKNYTKHGEGYWLDINILPLKDDNGATTHFVAIERDVTEAFERGRMASEYAGADSLTGACNRHTFLDHASHEISRAKRYGDPLALAVLDLDHFTAINDTYGRAAGDAVLQAFSVTCNSILRGTDIFARIGGEEFAILMPSTPPDAAHATMERVRRDLAATPIHWDGRSIQTGVSIGLATYLPFDESIEPILQRADAALYQAKTDGRNPVASAPTEPLKRAKPELTPS